MEENNKNNTTHYKTKTKLFRGKTKHILLLLPAILLLTCILALPIASGPILTIAQPHSNSINSNGVVSSNAKQITALGGGTSDGMSLVGNMTVTGNSTLNGILNLSKAEQVILGLPLLTSGELRIVADNIEIGKPCSAGNEIILTGNESNPSIVGLKGNIFIGNQSGVKEIQMNITSFYQYVESYSKGHIGDYPGDYAENWTNVQTDLPINTKDAIKVHQGTLYIFSTKPINPTVISITNTTFTLDSEIFGLKIHLPIDLDPYNGVANVSKLKEDGKFGLLSIFITEVMDTCCMYWGEPIIFEAWGPWFAIGPGGGIVTMLDTYTWMISNESIYYKFLDDFAGGGFRVTPSAHYPKSEMNVTTPEQNITGSGSTYVTNGSMFTNGTTSIQLQNQIINGTLTFAGDMLQEGNITVQGNIGISGYSYMQGLITVDGNMNINNGLTTGKITLTIASTMETTGSMTITNGEIKIPSGSMVMNSTGAFITGDTINVTGDQITSQGITEVNGDITMKAMTGDLGISGYSYMQGLITVDGNMNINNGLITGTITLTIDGTMETTGTMNILNGEISVPGGSIVMNDTGAFITGNTISVSGDQINSLGKTEANGDVTIQGDIGISGYNYMQGSISIRAPLLSLNSTMVTDGTMSITGGAINIQNGNMVMNDTGSYITGDTITVTGTVDFNGEASIIGDIGISGHNYMQGNVNVAQLSLNGVMVTDGNMSIANGAISITGGSMVMNGTGSYIIGNKIMVTGTVDFNGSATITGDIGLSGYNYMQGLITVQGYMNINSGLTSGTLTLTIGSTMETTGTMTITSGTISIPSGSMVMNSTGAYITGDTITVTGDQIVSLGITEINGDVTIQGDIGISGHNYMQGNINIRSPLLSLDGTMDTTGTMSITDGEINVQNGNMVMNGTGSYITGDMITVTGIVDFNGNASISGDIGISGLNYMQGNVNVAQLSLNGVMNTTGTMSITDGEISIQSGHMVMNDTGSYITSDTGISVTGTVNFNGDASIQGSNIGISGYNYMQGEDVNVAQLLSLNGTMVTDGAMSIANGEIGITGGSMALNSTGSFITGNNITVSGVVNLNGNATITGDIGISGHSYMQGLITVQSGNMDINNGLTTGNITLTIGSMMETTGTMNITSGKIIIPSGSSMVMNSTGSFITGSTINVTGDQIVSLGTTTVSGNITMTGDIGISGYSNMQGLITVQGSMNINNGVTTGTITLTIDGTMETTGSMNIVNGGISVPEGNIVMNSTGAYIAGNNGIAVNGTLITSQGTIDINGNTTMTGNFSIGGNSYIKGPVSVSGPLNINGGSMTGTGTITVSNGYMQMVGGMSLANGVVTVSGKIVMSPTGTTIGSSTSITGSSIAVSGAVTNSGSVTMSGSYTLLIPMYITGSMVTSGIMTMGSLGTVNGVMTITGSTVMTGVTVINGVNNIMGSMTVSPSGAVINGAVSLTGSVFTSNTPTIGPSTVLEINSGSLNGMFVPQVSLPAGPIVSILSNPIILASIGILGVGTVYVVARSVYIGIKERQTLGQRIRRLSKAFRRLSEAFRRQS